MMQYLAMSFKGFWPLQSASVSMCLVLSLCKIWSKIKICVSIVWWYVYLDPWSHEDVLGERRSPVLRWTRLGLDNIPLEIWAYCSTAIINHYSGYLNRMGSNWAPSVNTSAVRFAISWIYKAFNIFFFMNWFFEVVSFVNFIFSYVKLIN